MDSLEALFDPEAERAAESTAEYRIEQLLALNKAAIAITSELDLDKVLQRIVDVARELVHCKYAALGVLGEDGYIARFPTSGLSETEREKLGTPPRGHGLLGVMLRAGRILRIPDISKDPRRVGFPPNHPRMTSLLGVPIFVQGKLVGDLYLTDKIGRDEFNEEDEWIVQLLATHAATALTNAQLHEENKQAFESLRALQDAVQRIASHLDLKPMAEELLRYASEMTNSDLSWLGLVDGGTIVTPIVTRGGGPDDSMARAFALDLSSPDLPMRPAGQALLDLRPYMVSDALSDPATNPWSALRDKYRIGSGLAVPLVYQGKAIGVLTLYSHRQHAFDQVDQTLMQVMADHAAVALQNAIHYRQVTRERARSMALLRVTQAINRSVQLDEVIPLIVESAVDLLGAAGAAVYLLELGEHDGDGTEADQHVTARYSVGLEQPASTALRLPIGRSVTGRALRTQETQVVADTRDEPETVFPSLVGMPVRSMVVVPLISGDVMHGVLSVYSERAKAFGAEEIQFVEAFGAQASIAIGNAQLYREAELGRQAAELEQQRLREVEHMKDEFLSTAAHELRTPLTAIRMAAGLAYEQLKGIASVGEPDGTGGIDNRLVDLVGLVLEGSERMHSLVNDLLDLTRLEQGRTVLVMEDLDLRDVVTSSAEATRPLFESKKQRLSVHLPESYCGVRGDRVRLEQVVINLLSNAHKYSPASSNVSVRVIRTADECQVMVRDNGPGVPEDEREKIFERFYRSRLHRKDRTASTGLGLPIARTIAEMHKGRLWVESAPEQGSIFTLALPLAV